MGLVLTLVCIAVIFTIVLILRCKVLSWKYSSAYPKNCGQISVGHIFSLNFQPSYEQLVQWHRQLGKMVIIRTPWCQVVSVSDVHLIQTVLKSSWALDKLTTRIHEIFHRDKSIVYANGKLRRYIRKFIQYHMHSLGVGKPAFDELINRHVDEYMKNEINPNEGRPADIHKSLARYILDILWKVVSGEDKFPFSNEAAADYRERYIRLHQRMTPFKKLSVALPSLDCLWLRLPAVEKAKTEFQLLLNESVKPTLEEHRSKFKTNKTNRDNLVDIMLSAQQQNRNLFSDDQILRILFDFFLTGAETIRTTVMWALYFICTVPEVQQKIQREVDDAIGRVRRVYYEDRINMPYTQAFIMEVMRSANIVPQLMARVASKRCTLNGHQFEKGTRFIMLIGEVHSNGDHFPQPDQFIPERYMEDSSKLRKCDFSMPFSMGRRSCMAEALARREQFILIVSLLQKFTLHLPDAHQHANTMKTTTNNKLDISNFHVVALPRRPPDV